MSSATLDKGEARALYRQMMLIRRFEERAAEMYSAEKIRGFLHLYDGEEAVACGVMEELTPADAVLSTYREHGHALARGISARAVMAELYGRSTGASHGRGGSMHIFDVERRFFGGSAIVAGGLPLAVGLALAEKVKGTDAIAACFFGDGAVAEGEFHESMNLASLWRLPVLFVCENNQYAMGTTIRHELADTDIAKKAEGYAMSAATVDGMDLLAVRDAARDAVARVRSSEGPFLLECRTYRFRAHSMFDAQLYREKAEVRSWRERDPIATFEQRAREAGWLDDDDVAAVEAEVGRVIDDATSFAEASPFEPRETLLRGVYTDRGVP